MNKTIRRLACVLCLLATLRPVHAATPARQAGYLYLSPVPGASYESQQTRFILVRFIGVAPADVTNLMTTFFTVTGAASGIHVGTTHVASDGRTVIYTMTNDFSANEEVTVALNPELAPGASGTLQPFTFAFMVTAPFPNSPSLAQRFGPLPAGYQWPVTEETTNTVPQPLVTGPSTNQPRPMAVIEPNGVSVPSDFAVVSVSVNKNPSPGYLFLEPGVGLTSMYTMILDNDGLPVFYRRGRYYDFKIQQNGMITWCSDPSSQGFPAFDQNFNYLKTYVTTNGYSTDGHDLKILPDGTYLMIGTRNNVVNMGLYVPGAGSATVTETVVQEFTPEGDLILQFRAWDNYDIRISGADFPHLNGVDFDTDGNILISARHLSEVTKVNKDSGDIMWRLSGAYSSFHFINDPYNGTSAQHNICHLGNNHYTVFDNGNTRTPLFSRAVEYQLDLTNMTATLVWQYRSNPDMYSYWLGNVQRLDTGNTLIDFVRPQYPKVLEVDPSGTIQYQMTFAPTSDTYRAFRLPWTGSVAVPYLVVERQPDNVVLVFNKFGDHTVDYYKIYGGTSSGSTNLLATSRATLFHYTNAVNGVINYFRVTAVSTNGVESGFSNEGSLLVNISVPGQNVVLNGDFSQGTNAWTWLVTPPAAAQWSISNGVSHFAIASGGTYLSDVQLMQPGIKLTQGNNYIFEFDAWSPVPRAFEANVESSAGSGTNYSGIQPFTITPVTNHYSFHFTMSQPSDNNAQLVFNMGALPFDVYLANVSLRQQVYAPGDFNQDGCVGLSDLEVLLGEWQQRQFGLPGDLNRDGKVDFADFVIFANSWSGGLCP